MERFRMILSVEIYIFVATFVISVLAFRKWKNGGDKHIRRYPPSLPSLPLVGSLPFIRNFYNLPEFLLEKAQHLGPVFTLRAGGKLMLTLNSTEAVHDALKNHSREFSSRPPFFIILSVNPERKGLGVMDTSPKWKLIHQNALSIMKELGFGVKNLMEERILNEVEAMIEYGKKKQGQSFDPKELSLLMTTNVMLNILFGRRHPYELGLSEFVHESDRYSYCADMVFDIVPFLKYVPPFSRKISMMADCDKKLNEMMDEEIDQILKDESNESFVRRHIENEGPNYDRSQLHYLLRDVFLGGTDTGACFFRWSLVAMANHQEIQTKLQTEIDSVIPSDRYPRIPDEKDLPYVGAAILELQRWRTLVPLSVARFTSADSTLRDYFIPAGTMVFPNLYAAHNDPNVWEDPKVFRPERFLDRQNNIIGKDRIIPFGIGRRSCFGETLARAEVFLFFTSLLQRFVVLPPDGQTSVGDKPQLPITLINHPEPFSIRLIERQ